MKKNKSLKTPVSSSHDNVVGLPIQSSETSGLDNPTKFLEEATKLVNFESKIRTKSAPEPSVSSLQRLAKSKQDYN